MHTSASRNLGNWYVRRFNLSCNPVEKESHRRFLEENKIIPCIKQIEQLQFSIFQGHVQFVDVSLEISI